MNKAQIARQIASDYCMAQCELVDLWNDWCCENGYNAECIMTTSGLLMDCMNYSHENLLKTFANGYFNVYEEFYHFDNQGNAVSSNWVMDDLLDAQLLYAPLVEMASKDDDYEIPKADDEEELW